MDVCTSSVSVLSEARRDVTARIAGVGSFAATGLQAKVASPLGGEATFGRLVATLTRRLRTMAFWILGRGLDCLSVTWLLPLLLFAPLYSEVWSGPSVTLILLREDSAGLGILGVGWAV